MSRWWHVLYLVRKDENFQASLTTNPLKITQYVKGVSVETV